MEQMILTLIIALLVWVGTGIGRHDGATERDRIAGEETSRNLEATPRGEPGTGR